MKKQILISTSSFAKFDQAPLDRLKSEEVDVTLNPFGRKVTEEEFLPLAKEIHGLIAGTETLSAEVLKQLPSLKVISRCGVGMDNVDLESAKNLGIKVFNTPTGPTQAVGELTIGLMLDLLREVSLSDSEVKSGIWKKRMGSLLADKTVGIIGFGQIGQYVAKLASAFGAKVVYYDPFLSSKHDDYRSLSLEDLLSSSDLVTLHVSYSKDTHHLINEKQLSLMKSNAYLINCSRGGVVNEEALVDCLNNNSIAGAAVDVFENEPYNGPLTQFKNVILTPHIGSYAKEARIKMEIESVENLLKGFEEIVKG